WWSQAGSNRRPPACHAGALPAELWPQTKTGTPAFAKSAFLFLLDRRFADDIGHVAAFFLLFDEGSVFDCVVAFLALASGFLALLLGVGVFERNQFGV